MSGGFESKPGSRSLVQKAFEGNRATTQDPGKRTLTEQRSHDLPIMRKATGAAEVSRAAVQAQIAPASQGNGGSPSGSPVDASIRGRVEQATGADLGGVRIHTGADSSEAAASVGARAYAGGQDVHFGAGEYRPGTPGGDHLIAHELVHTIQQAGSAPSRQDKLAVSEPGDHAEVEADRIASAVVDGSPRPGSLVPSSAPAAIQRAPLDQEPTATKQKLKVDTDENLGNYRKYFGLKGTPTLASNVSATYEETTPQIDSINVQETKDALHQGLHLYALALFDLLPDDDGKTQSKRLNLVHVENLDLTTWGGPNTSFRFTSIGQTDPKGQINVRILIEALSLSSKAMSDPVTAAGIEKMAAKYGITRDSSVSDDTWNKVLRSIGRIQETVIMRLRDVPFYQSDKDAGAKGEAAEYKDAAQPGGAWSRKIILYKKLLGSNDDKFAFTIEHELGHALDHAPAEQASGFVTGSMTHNDPKFKEAAKKDGGRNEAITAYARTDDHEFFAECFAMFVSKPDTLQALRPNIYQYFHDYQWGALSDPKLNPYKSGSAGMGAGVGAGLPIMF